MAPTYVCDDANGNLLAIAGSQYARTTTWDGLDRLSSVTFGGQTTTIGYGPDGRRVTRTVKAAGAAAETTTDFADAEIAPDGTWTKYPLADAKRVGTGAAAKTYGVHLDSDGSIRAVTNRAGEVTTTLGYIPYGLEQRTEIAAAPAPEDRSFIGQHFDPSTAPSYLNARY